MPVLDTPVRLLLAALMVLWTPLWCCCLGDTAGGEGSGRVEVKEAAHTPSSCHDCEPDSTSENSHSRSDAPHCPPDGDHDCSHQLQVAGAADDAFPTPSATVGSLLPVLQLLPAFMTPDIEQTRSIIFSRLSIRLPSPSEGTLRAQHVLMLI